MLARINTFICEKVFHTIYSSKRGFSRMNAFFVIIRQNSPIWCALALCDVGRAYDNYICFKKSLRISMHWYPCGVNPFRISGVVR